MADYGFVHENHVFTPQRSAVDVTENEARNRAREDAELAMWRLRPACQVAYYDEQAGTVSTWLDTVLGTILMSRIYRHRSGQRCISLRVRATNGAEYHGRASYDNGTCITLHRCGSGPGA